MAEISEAFNTSFNYINNKEFETIDYFITHRNVIEKQEYLDMNMMMKTKKTKKTHHFLGLNIPIIKTISQKDQADGFEIEIYGNQGFNYKGIIKSYQGTLPNLIFPLKTDTKIFVNVNYTFTNVNENIQNKRYITFIDIPKRSLSIDKTENQSKISENDNNDANLSQCDEVIEEPEIINNVEPVLKNENKIKNNKKNKKTIII